ncbi:MAG: hypothetical protein ACT4NX_05150 [Deltaproteobacteria bacterium]
MPLYEYECIKCRKNIEQSLQVLEGKVNKETLCALVEAHDNINFIEVADLTKRKIVAKYGKRAKDGIDLDFYLNEGKKLVLFNAQKYRFSELIYDREDEKNVKCQCGEAEQVERVISGFAYTKDLSTNMPKPDLSNIPPSMRNKVSLTGYIEEKDRPKKNR